MIDNQKQLDEILPLLKSAAWLAIDTEADSLHAYPEKLCLLQVSVAGADMLIDTLASLDIGPLLDIFKGHELILHGGDYDLRLMRRSWNFVPRSVFDTMLAARILGMRAFRLTHLVGHYLGVTLEKGPQKANWSRRPLTERMQTYAHNDTRYLKPLADRLRQELADKGRLSWHAEICANLVTDCAQIRDRDPNLSWRVTGSDGLSRKALGVLREIWRWREREARRNNKPPYFVLSHEALAELAAKSLTQPLDALLPAHWPPQRRTSLSQAVERGLSLPPGKQPEFLRPARQRISEAAHRRLQELKQRRDRRASELGIDPVLIASRTTLVHLAQDWATNHSQLMPWQLALLQG